MKIDIVWDPSAQAGGVPAGLQIGIDYAVNFLESVFTNTGTVSVNVGYGTCRGQALASGEGGLTSADGVLTSGTVVTFAEYVLTGNTFIANPDAYIGFATTGIDYSDINSASGGLADFIGIAEHELTHALGRLSWNPSTSLSNHSLLDMFRYSAPRTLATATSLHAYFSLDGGVTDLGDFETSGDLADWKNSGFLTTDAFAGGAAANTTLTLSRSDFLLMQALGFSLSNQFIGSDTNLAGTGGYDLLFLGNSNNFSNALKYDEYSSTGTVALTATLRWQSDGATSPENNAVLLDPTSAVTGTGTNALGHGGHDIIVTLGYGTGPSGTYEFTPSGNVYVAGTIVFDGTGDTINATPGSNLRVTGLNNAVNGSMATINAATQSSTSIYGNNDQVTAVAGAILGFDGANETVTASGITVFENSSTTSVTIVGTNDLVGAVSGATISFSGAREYVNASGATINATSASASVSVNGNNNIVNAVSGSVLGIAGIGETVRASGITIFETSSTTSVTVVGTNDLVGAVSGATISFSGAREYVNASGATINETSASASVSVNGNNNIVNAVSGSVLGIAGIGETVTASGITIFETSSTTSVTVVGTNDLVGAVSGATISFSGAREYVNASGATINETSASASVSVDGNNNTVNAVSGSVLGIAGIGETVTGSGITIYGGASTTMTVSPSGSGTDVVGLYTSSELMWGSTNGMGFITGASDSNTVYASAGSQTVYGFNMEKGDKLDFSQMLAGTGVTSSTISNYVTVTASGSNTTLAINGPHAFNSVLLAGSGALTLSGMISGNAFVY